MLKLQCSQLWTLLKVYRSEILWRVTSLYPLTCPCLPCYYLHTNTEESTGWLRSWVELGFRCLLVWPYWVVCSHLCVQINHHQASHEGNDFPICFCGDLYGDLTQQERGYILHYTAPEHGGGWEGEFITRQPKAVSGSLPSTAAHILMEFNRVSDSQTFKTGTWHCQL